MPIRWDKFTVKAQEAVKRANQLASEHGNPELRPIHLLGALLEDKEGIVPPVLEKIGIGLQAVLAEVYKELEKLPKVSEIGRPIHLLGALLEDKEGIVPPVLEKIGIGLQAVLAEVYKELEKLPKVSGSEI